MINFKKGDTVRMARDYCDLNEGDKGRVIYVEPRSYYGDLQVFIAIGHQRYWLKRTDLLKVNTDPAFKDNIRDYEVGELVMVVDDVHEDAPHKMEMFSVCRINDKHIVKENDRRRVLVLRGSYEGQYRWVATEDVVPLNIMMEIEDPDFKVGEYIKGDCYRKADTKLAKVEELLEESGMHIRILDHKYNSLIGDIVRVENSNKLYKKVEIK